MAQALSYILAPNFTFKDEPDQPTWLGRIIADPFNPRRDLGALTISDASIVSVIEEEHTHTRSESHSASASVWSNFLQIASVDVGVDKAPSSSTTYSMEKMETRYLRDDPTNEQVTKHVSANARAQAAISSGMFGNKPLYVITGLKIAKGLRVDASVGLDQGAHIGGRATATPDGSVSVGAEHGTSMQMGKKDSFKSIEDVIFAYQLHAIVTKGWRTKRLEVDSFRPKAAFLSVEDAADAEMEVILPSKLDYELLLANSLKDGEVKILDMHADGGPEENTACLYAVGNVGDLGERH